MDRKLASIQKIINIEPISEADNIDVATILGWKVVVPKNQYKIGDLIVFCEIDSLLPRAPWNEFLFKDKNKTDWRLRTVKLKGQVSQGIVFPLSILPNYNDAPPSKEDGFMSITNAYVEGVDVTDILGIKKWEPYIPAQLAGMVKSLFPSFLHKTDETRIQSVPKVLERNKSRLFYITEKLDGASMTVYAKDGEFGICSRNLDLKEDPNNAYWKVAEQLDLRNKLASVGKNIAIQGELYGEGIQKNKYGLKGLHFAMFNVFDIDTDTYYGLHDMELFSATYDIPLVPILNKQVGLEFTVDELVSLSIGTSQLNNSVQREGIVLRSIFENRDEDLGRLSFKVINPEFLLKYGE